MTDLPAHLSRRQILRGLASFSALTTLTACGGTAGVERDRALDDALAMPVLVDDNANPDSGVFFGIFREASLTDVVTDVPADLRRKPAAAMWFTRFGSAFPENQIRYLAMQGMAAQVTWEPWEANDKAISLAAINAGDWDRYIDEWGQAAARLDLPFMLRFGHEFNGDWYPWSLSKNDRDGEAYKRAFRRVVTRMRAAGAARVQHVWCFNNDSQPAQPWNDPRTAYPGDDVVDWIGIDGYNFGTSQSWSRWTPFKDLFSRSVDLANELSPRKPIILGEMGCSETGGDKAAWIRQMFADLAHMPSVRAFTWFDTIKETSWSLTSSDAAWLAAVESLRKPVVRSNGTALLSIVGAQK